MSLRRVGRLCTSVLCGSYATSGESSLDARAADFRSSDIAFSSRSNGVSSMYRSRRLRESSDAVAQMRVLDVGQPEHICRYCGASFWYRERCLKTSRANNLKYNLCCKEGRVKLPQLKQVPDVLRKLLCANECPDSNHFRKLIRVYNSMFSFTSFGCNVDDSINDGTGPYIFKISGQISHRMGSLLPLEGQKPAFAQLYVYDTENELQNRMDPFCNSSSQNRPKSHIVEILRAMFNEYNVLVREYRTIKERIMNVNVPEFHIRIRSDVDVPNPQYSFPTAPEIVGFVVGDISGLEPTRDIVVEHRSNILKRIRSDNEYYMPMQYPLVFVYGEKGFHRRIPYAPDMPGSKKVKRQFMTMAEYYAFRLHPRPDEISALFQSGKLLQQVIVDMYVCVEQDRLRFIECNQTLLRADKLSNIRNAVMEGDMFGRDVGKRIVLPASHVGGPRYMFQNYHDAITLCRRFGPPDLFITFTSNPQWPEILRTLPAGQRPEDRPDIVCRVFKMKYDQLIDDIKKGRHFGKVIAVISQIEFQKRGLPHTHIIVWLDERDKLKTADDVDRVITAELPDPYVDKFCYDTVCKYMLHGPCGVMNDHSPCMKDGRCSKNFPKAYAENTVINEDGSVVYRRRDNNSSYERAGKLFTNAHVVPYNMDLLLKYQSHLNVEKCYSPELIKYLFKYVYKGSDRQYISINDESRSEEVINEVSNYLDCRCITPPEAIWRLYQYDIHESFPSVERLPIHLPGENTVIFNDNDRLDFITNNSDLRLTKLTGWFTLNQTDKKARCLKYEEIPEKYVWNSGAKIWTRRKKQKRLGRIFYVHPCMGELYYLRLLLAEIRGATSFESLRTINGVVYASFQEACRAIGLVDDGTEWVHAIIDSASWANSYHLRKLFVYILIYSEPSNPLFLWEKTWHLFGDDIVHRFKISGNSGGGNISDEVKKNYILECLEKDLMHCGKSLTSYNLPLPSSDITHQIGNRLIKEQMCFNRPGLGIESVNMRALLNVEQLKVYNAIMKSIDERDGKFFFVYGHGGTGKTFLWQTIMASVRSKGLIVLPVASSGLAALLLEGGCTAHSRFKIPADKPTVKTCDIGQGTLLADLIQHTSLIIWDEAPMNHRQCFEALDTSLRDIMGTCDTHCRNKLFGGITVLLGGDFRQTLPIISGGTRHDTVNACITNSPLWSHCQVFKLSTNMRLLSNNMTPADRHEAAEFAKWLINVGDGDIEGHKLRDLSHSDWINMPSSLLLPSEPDGYSSIISCTYPDLQSNYKNPQYLCERAIVTPTNEDANNVNAKISDLIPGETFTYLSCDTLHQSEKMAKKLRDMYPPEYLNLLTPNGVPGHVLSLKIGTPIMLIRNIDQSAGLCNGTRLIVVRLTTHCIEGEIMTGHARGTRTLIPRIIFIKKELKWAFTLRRKQFPVRVCYAMTINKSQGQTLSNIGIYLPRPVFSHGQLYVALSRAKCKKGVKILITNQDVNYASYTRNIVFREVFARIGATA